MGAAAAVVVVVVAAVGGWGSRWASAAGVAWLGKKEEVAACNVTLRVGSGYYSYVRTRC